MPIAAAVAAVAWVILARARTRAFHGYLDAALGGGGERGSGVNATMVYRRAQALPYRLALISLVLWILVATSAAAFASSG